MTTTSEFPEVYIEEVFYKWYEGGRKVDNKFINSLTACSDGRIPKKDTVNDWGKDRGWAMRADALDAEVSIKKDELVVDRRIKMWEEQEKVAAQLVTKGMEYLDENGIQNSANALRSIDLGLTTQRVSTGMAEMVTKITKMSDIQITAELQKLLGKKEEIIDAEVDEE